MQLAGVASIVNGYVCVQQRNNLISAALNGRKRPSRYQSANFTPEDNQPENLIALCTPCHLALHGRTKRSNVSPGQLSRSVSRCGVEVVVPYPCLTTPLMLASKISIAIEGLVRT
jgi:hypothetical protein